MSGAFPVNSGKSTSAARPLVDAGGEAPLRAGSASRCGVGGGAETGGVSAAAGVAPSVTGGGGAMGGVAACAAAACAPVFVTGAGVAAEADASPLSAVLCSPLRVAGADCTAASTLFQENGCSCASIASQRMRLVRRPFETGTATSNSAG